jgi:Flp pilus assembly protein TadG
VRGLRRGCDSAGCSWQPGLPRGNSFALNSSRSFGTAGRPGAGMACKNLCSQLFTIEVKWRHFFGKLLLRAKILAAGFEIFDRLQTKINQMEAAMTRNKESGQALVFTAVAMFVLIGFAGLAVDMGALRYQKRLQQTAADAAAIAGASNLASATLGVTAGAQNASAANGFTDNSGGTTCTNSPGTVGCVTVTVNNPPLSGPHAGAADASKYVEVLVTVVQPTYFMKAVGFPSETITARAVATNVSGGAGSGCLFTLGSPTGQIEGININGKATLNAPVCGIEDNGDFNTKGNALTVNAGTFGEVGSTNANGPGGTVNCFNQPGPCPATGMPAATNPMSNLTPPLAPPCNPCTVPSTNPAPVTQNGVTTYGPGTYSSISIGPATVNFSPGLYIIDGSGGLTINANATVTGTGVTFYFANTATIDVVGTPSINLTAPSSGSYADILMYQDPADTNTTGPQLGGNSGSSFTGIVYFPSDQLTFFGNANGTDCNSGFTVSMVIADSIALSGHPTVCLSGEAGLPVPNPLVDAVLVE